MTRPAVLACTFLVLAATWIRPIWPAEQALHDSLIVFGLGAMWRYDRRHGVADADLVLACLFVCVHAVAARWLYSNVPYESWLRHAFGWTLHDLFGWTRNHFDRLVHLLYGLCFTRMVAVHGLRTRRLSPMEARALAVGAIMVTSLWYEWFEWGVAVLLSAEDAEAYNGQQGDVWDAHKDMLMASLGALIACFFSLRNHRPVASARCA